MQKVLKASILTVLIFSVLSLCWYLVNATSYFQRGMDLIGTSFLVSLGVPILMFVLLFSILLVKGWTPTHKIDYVGITAALLLSTLLATALLQSVSAYNWNVTRIDRDTLKITADEKYEYQIELIQLFQRNSHARLYLKEIGSGEEIYIPVSIQARRIVTLSVGKENHWVELTPTNEPSTYILSTSPQLRIPMEKFAIHLDTRDSTKIE